MLCPACGYPNRDGAGFCGSCGQSLSREVSCSACGSVNPAGQRFCDSCGRRLEGSSSGEPVPAPAPEVPLPGPFAEGRYELRATAIQRAFAAYNAEHPEVPLRVRIGLHTGEALKDADKFFGKTVILASRIADQARGGEILISSLLKELTSSTGDLRFGASREVQRKGLREAQTLYPVEWR